MGAIGLVFLDLETGGESSQPAVWVVGRIGLERWEGAFSMLVCTTEFNAVPALRIGLNDDPRTCRHRVPVLISASAFARIVAAFHSKTHGFQARGFPILPQQASLAGNCNPTTAAPRQCRTTRRPAQRKTSSLSFRHDGTALAPYRSESGSNGWMCEGG